MTNVANNWVEIKRPAPMTTDGSTEPAQLGVGEFLAAAEGTFDGATATLQMSIDSGATWIGVASYTDIATKVEFNPVRGALFRWTVSSSDTNTEIQFTIAQAKP